MARREDAAVQHRKTVGELRLWRGGRGSHHVLLVVAARITFFPPGVDPKTTVRVALATVHELPCLCATYGTEASAYRVQEATWQMA